MGNNYKRRHFYSSKRKHKNDTISHIFDTTNLSGSENSETSENLETLVDLENETEQTEIENFPGRELTLLENLLEDSRLPGIHNGSVIMKPINSQPNNDQKWLFALILGLLFVILAAAPSYLLSQRIYYEFSDHYFPTTPLWAVCIHGIIFILIIRLILW